MLEIFFEIPQNAIPALDDGSLGDADPSGIFSGGYAVKEQGVDQFAVRVVQDLSGQDPSYTGAVGMKELTAGLLAAVA